MTEFLSQLSNFVNSLIALSSSRNYITQFLYLIKINGSIDYCVLEEAYPELMKEAETRENLAKAFGIIFSENVSLEEGKMGKQLTAFIEGVFKLFEDADFRGKVGALLKDEYPQGIPNLAKEWVEVRVSGLKSEPHLGSSALTVLKKIAAVGKAKVEELEKSLGLGKGVLIGTIELLGLYKLVVKEYDGSYRLADDLKKYQEIL